MKSALHFSAILIASLAVATCSKPDARLCSKYYSHLVSLASVNDGVMIGLKTAEARTAIMEYCSSLKKSQVNCALQSSDLSEAGECERKKPGVFDNIF